MPDFNINLNLETLQTWAVAMLAALIQSGFWISHLVSFVISRRVNRVIEEDAGSATTLNAVKIVAKGRCGRSYC